MSDRMQSFAASSAGLIRALVGVWSLRFPAEAYRGSLKSHWGEVGCEALAGDMMLFLVLI